MKTAQTTKLLLLASLLLLLAACGKSKTDGSYDQASQSVTDVNSSAGKAMAYCNSAASTQLSVRNGVYQESNTVRLDFLKARITQIPEAFSSNTSYLQIYRWKANSNGQTYLDPQALQFRLITAGEGQNLNNYNTVLQYSHIAHLLRQLNVSTVKDFFNSVTLVIDLKDPYAEFDAMKVVLYNSSNQVVDQVDMLIPMFAANPEAYAKDGSATRAQALQHLHPFKGMLGQTWNEAHYQTLSNAHCF